MFSNTEPSATEGVETESLFVSDAEVNDTTGPAKPTSDSPFSTAKSTNKGLFSNSFANGVQG